MIDDDKDEIDVLNDYQQHWMMNKIETLKQLEELKKSFKNQGMTEKEIKDLMKPHYKSIKNFFKNKC